MTDATPHVKIFTEDGIPVDWASIVAGGTGGGAGTTLLDGTLTATTSAAALPSNACSEVTVVNDPTSTVDIKVGNATSQSMRVQPGQSVTASLANTNLLYVKSVSGTATVNWWAV